MNIIDPTDLHKYFVVHVPLDNKRIMNQQCLFLMAGMGDNKTEPAKIEDSVFINDNKKLIFIISDSYRFKLAD